MPSNTISSRVFGDFSAAWQRDGCGTICVDKSVAVCDGHQQAIGVKHNAHRSLFVRG